MLRNVSRVSPQQLPSQAAHFASQMAIGTFYNDKFNLNNDSKYMAIMFANQAYHVDVNEVLRPPTSTKESQRSLTSHKRSTYHLG